MGQRHLRFFMGIRAGDMLGPKSKFSNILKIITILVSSLLLSLFFSCIHAVENFSDASSDNSSQESDNQDERRLWNLDDVDILALIGEISRVTGRNFVIDPRVTGKASLVSNDPMTNQEAYAAFQSILQILGFSVIESGPVSKIVPSSVAKQYDTKVNHKNLQSLGDEMVVQVLPVKHVTATALIPILRNLVNQQGHIAPYAPSNVIVIADHASNVARIKEIINRIDQESSEDVEIITLTDASSDEVVKVLTQLLARGQQMGEPANQQVKLASDTRTNSVLLSGDKTRRLKIRALIAQMDVPTPRTGDTEVIYLQYQNAEDLVPVIATVMDAYYGKQSNSLGSGMTSSASRSSAGAASTAADATTSEGLYSSTTELDTSKRGEGGALSAPGVRAETNTNSIVVTAPKELMRNIKAVINKLDIRRYQVLVEALIVEVSLQHALNLGVEWRLPHFNEGFYGGTNFGNPVDPANTINGLINATPSPPTKDLPLAGATIGFLRGGDIRAIITALGSDTNTNILSTPSLVTMDNETAEIVVARNIPFKTGEFANLAGQGTQQNTIEYRDVGLKLKLTPMITKGDTVKLTVEQSQGNVLSESAANTPTTTTRSIKTVVAVNNNDILVLGGLVQGQNDGGELKIPLLGDLPWIGQFFKREVNSLTRRNLMVFIRPVVLRTAEESYNVSINKYDLMRDGQLLHALDPYGKIAKELMPEMPDKAKGIEQKLNLPEPFKESTIIDKIASHEVFD